MCVCRCECTKNSRLRPYYLLSKPLHSFTVVSPRFAAQCPTGSECKTNETVLSVGPHGVEKCVRRKCILCNCVSYCVSSYTSFNHSLAKYLIGLIFSAPYLMKEIKVYKSSLPPSHPPPPPPTHTHYPYSPPP